MRKSSAALALGALVGGVVIGLTLGSIALDNTTDPKTSNAHRVSEAKRPISISPDENLPRPTLDEVWASTGIETVGMLSRYLEAATIDEIVALLEGIEEAPNHISSLTWLILAHATQHDPRAILEWSRSQGESQDWITYAYQWWAMSDPAAALEFCLLHDLELESDVLTAMLWGDPEEAYAAVLKWAPDSPRMESLKQERWKQSGERNTEAALAEAMALSNSEEETQAIRAVIEGWSATDPIAAMKWLENQTFEGINELMMITLEEIGKINPRLCLNTLENLSPSQSRNKLQRQTMSQWSSDDPEGALAWLKTQPSGQHRDQLFAAMADDLEKDPKRFLELMQELKINPYHGFDHSRATVETSLGRQNGITGRSNDHYLRDHIYRASLAYGRESPEKAMEALYRIGGANYGGAGEIANEWIRKAPEEAASWALALPESRFAQEMQREVIEAWSDHSVRDTVDFLAKHNCELPVSLIGEVATRWNPEDASDAIEWAEQFEGHPRDEALSIILNRVAVDDPYATLQLVDKVKDYSAHQRVLTQATASWMTKDPESAMSWLATQPAEAGVDEVIMSSAKSWVLQRPSEASRC